MVDLSAAAVVLRSAGKRPPGRSLFGLAARAGLVFQVPQIVVLIDPPIDRHVAEIGDASGVITGAADPPDDSIKSRMRRR